MTVIIVVWWTGGMGVLPSSSELASGGVRELDAEEEEIGSASREPSSGMVLRPGPTGAEGGGKARSPMDNLRAGLPPISKRLVERIQSNESIDFAELPSAKGKSWPNSQLGDNQIVVVQAADLMQSRRVIPDLAALPLARSSWHSLPSLALRPMGASLQHMGTLPTGGPGPGTCYTSSPSMLPAP